jgi:hypothetical protein
MPQLDRELCEWTETVSRKLPTLSTAQAGVLALYSFGMVLVQGCGLTSIAAFVGMLLGRKENSVRQQLREFTYEGDAKRGTKRQSVEVEGCFGGLLRWVLSWWDSSEQRLALAIDATNFKDIFTVLTVSVVYRGCAIPVAWRVLGATTKGAWQPHWEDLLETLQPGIPAEWCVIVLADRGLYAKWLYNRIVKLGWHPFLRLNQQGTFRTQSPAAFRPLAGVVNANCPNWSGFVTCFKTASARLDCTLLARFDPKYADPWLIVTDLPPDTADIAWYGMRAWIEAGFKDFKRGGWSWHQTKMTDPSRAARLWLVMAVAKIWVLSVGGYAEADFPPSSLPFFPPPYFPYRCRPRTASRPRLLSIFARGLLIILTALLRGDYLPFGDFVPEPWPFSPPLPASFSNTYP